MTNPLEKRWRLYLRPVLSGGSDLIDTGQTGDMDVLMDVGRQLTSLEKFELEDGRTFTRDQIGGYVVQPETEEASRGD